MRRGGYIWVLFGIQFVGYALTVAGVLREAFATLARELGLFEPGLFEPGLFEEKVSGGVLAWLQDLFVWEGAQLGLLQKKEELTLEGRRLNAFLAILGVHLTVASIILNSLDKWCQYRKETRKKTQKLRPASTTREMPSRE